MTTAAKHGDRAIAATTVARARDALGHVQDPEIPVISVLDLGIVRDIAVDDEGTIQVAVSPTYSGCPATAVIRGDITAALKTAGFAKIRVYEVLYPAWSTDWISEEGRLKLAAYGIAPPPPPTPGARTAIDGAAPVACPRCGSSNTEVLSEFGSTPCKALHRCRECLEPFDRFKCI